MPAVVPAHLHVRRLLQRRGEGGNRSLPVLPVLQLGQAGATRAVARRQQRMVELCSLEQRRRRLEVLALVMQTVPFLVEFFRLLFRRGCRERHQPSAGGLRRLFSLGRPRRCLGLAFPLERLAPRVAQPLLLLPPRIFLLRRLRSGLGVKPGPLLLLLLGGPGLFELREALGLRFLLGSSSRRLSFLRKPRPLCLPLRLLLGALRLFRRQPRLLLLLFQPRRLLLLRESLPAVLG